MPSWLAITQATATIAGVVITTIGVLVALWVAISNAKKNREERIDRGRQLAALQRAEDDRIAAQARRVVPTLVRSTVFGPNMWSVKVSNHSAAPVTEVSVRVVAVDSNGVEIPDGCEEANGKMGTSEMFRKVVEDAISGSADATLGRINIPMDASVFIPGMNMGAVPGNGGKGLGSMVAKRIAPQVTQAMQDALNGQMTTEWPTTLTPEQFAVMAYEAVDNTERLMVRIAFTDEAGYCWERADNGAPRQVGSQDD